MEILIVILIIGVLLTYTSFMGGLVVYKFWYWFLLPVFHDLPHITYAQAVGLMFFIGLFKYHGKSNEHDKDMENLTMTLVAPILMLIVGGVAHAFIY